jgi:molybdopterin synthase catalytic subunit
MLIRVLFFGVLKEMAGIASDSLELPKGATLADALRHYESRIPRLKELLPSVAVSVNREYAVQDVALSEGDEVALLPPVSGGAPNASIVRDRIDTQAVLQDLKAASDGAAVVFEGIVRDNTRGRRTLYLEYEGYEPMALKTMEELVTDAKSRFKVREILVVHRLGRLEIGETSVLIMVASAHRGPAFDACRWVIDMLKKIVPIWKKEFFEDGAVWADGEPFPAEILPRQGTSAGPDASK